MANALPSDQEILKTAALFSALAHAGRLRMLLALASGEALPAGVLGETAGLKQTAASHQLRLLKDARLVKTHRDGRKVLYTLCDTHVSHIVRDAIAHIQEE